MKRILYSAVTFCLAACAGQKALNPEDLAIPVDKSTQERILITTDLECDDMNGILLSLLYCLDIRHVTLPG